MKYELTASRIRKAMSCKNVSAQDVATATGIGKSSISQYVNGTNRPSNIKAGKLGDFLGVSPLWLMGFDVDMHEMPKLNATFSPVHIEIINIYESLSEENKELFLRLARSFR